MSRLMLVLPALLVACGSSSSGGAPGDAAPDTHVADAAPDAAACGLRTGKRGLTHRTITAGGLERTYLVYLPESADPSAPMPLVFVHHGYTMSGQAMYDVTKYADLADRPGDHIALAFPDGQGGPDAFIAPWNVGANVCPSTGGAPPNATGDDFAFLDAMKADISEDQCLDHAHMFVTGFSMGGYFSHHVGCMRDDIRAVAPASGGTHDLSACTTGHKPIIMFHGLADPLIPAGCDDPHSLAVLGTTPAATAWAAKNGCATTMTAHAVTGGTCYTYDGCPADGQVELCTFTAMGHCWAGGPPGIYGCTPYAEATALEWQFFKQYAW